ncbi:hypothetical protein T4C_665 [Trichinella pseudospiralis]|uniref:Uncharacterized protein n=1 Tax=Trichinella pseudospiralis TaxID=6337 RepID=A0A0V1JKX2_TRIPS|nr:hypothetical protein T4C_665 [Trichinella pseudospiralis]
MPNQSFNRTVKIHYRLSQWMHMLLRVRIANLILEVVVDHPNQSFNRTVKIHCRWLDYVLSDAGRFLIDSNIRNFPFSTSYIPFDLCDPHSPASSACPAIIRARARALLFLKLLRYFNQCSQRFFLISHPGFVTILPGAHPSHDSAHQQQVQPYRVRGRLLRFRLDLHSFVHNHDLSVDR